MWDNYTILHYRSYLRRVLAASSQPSGCLFRGYHSVRAGSPFLISPLPQGGPGPSWGLWSDASPLSQGWLQSVPKAILAPP